MAAVLTNKVNRENVYRYARRGMDPGRSNEPGALGLLSTYCPFTFFRKISSNWSGVFFARMELNWLR